MDYTEVLRAIGAIAETPEDAQRVVDYLQSIDWTSELNQYRPLHRTCTQCHIEYNLEDHIQTVRHKNLKEAYCPNCYQYHLTVRRIVKSHNGRAERLGLTADLTANQWLKTLAHFDNKCAYCGADYECLEHFIPVSAGGGTTANNCVPACNSCNMRKKYLHPLEDEHCSIPADRIEVVRQYLATRTSLKSPAEKLSALNKATVKVATHSNTILSGADYLSIQEAATLKGVTEQSVRDALKQNKFPGAVKIGGERRGIWQLPESEVQAWQPRKYPRD